MPSIITPDQAGGLQAWYKADSLQLNDGDPIATWPDSSGLGRDITGAGGSRPTFKKKILRDLPIVRYVGTSNNQLSNAAFPDFGDTYTCYLLASVAPNTGLNSTWFDVSLGAGNQGFAYLCRDDTGAKGHSSYNVDSIGQKNIQESFDVRDNVFRLISIVADGASVRFFRDTAQVGSVAYVSPNPNVLTRLDVGCRAGNIQFTTGDLAELAIHNAAHSDATRVQVQNYYLDKWLPRFFSTSIFGSVPQRGDEQKRDPRLRLAESLGVNARTLKDAADFVERQRHAPDPEAPTPIIRRSPTPIPNPRELLDSTELWADRAWPEPGQ